MDTFYFDLQRFNDEDEVGDNAEQLESGDSAEESGQPKPDFILKDGRIVFLHDDEDDDETEEDDGEPGEEDDEGKKEPEGTPAKEQAESKYTPSEIRELDFEDLDPKKIPEEMLPWYRSMQSGFTRKMQQLSEKEKALKPSEEQPPAEEGTPDLKAHISGLANLAKFQASQMLNIDPADFDRMDDDHEAAYQIALMKINKAVDANIEKESALVRYDAEMAEENPDYYKIKQWAKEEYIDEMPFKDRVGFEKAIKEADVKALNKKYFPMLKEAYDKAHGLEKPKGEQQPSLEEKIKQKSRPAAKPPELESDKSSESKVDKKFNAVNLKGKSLNEQINLLVKAGLAKP